MNKKIIINTTVFFSLLISALAWGYIPRAKFILGKVLETHGRGLYYVENEVVITDGATSTTVEESWLIQDAQTMFLTVKGPGFTNYYLYKDNKKYFLDSTKSENAISLSKDFVFPLFLFRSYDSMTSQLISSQIAPRAILSSREPLPHQLKNPENLKEDFVNLNKMGNTIMYVIGSNNGPGLWVEQDRFVIRKINTPTGIEMTADDYAEFSKGLWLPKQQSIKWSNHSAQIHLMKVRSLNESTDSKEKLSPTYFRTGGKNISNSPFNQPSVEEFYKRVR